MYRRWFLINFFDQFVGNNEFDLISLFEYFSVKYGTLYKFIKIKKQKEIVMNCEDRKSQYLNLFIKMTRTITSCVKVKNLPNSSASQSYALSSFVYNLRSQF